MVDEPDNAQPYENLLAETRWLGRLAAQLVPPADREDLVQDVLLSAMRTEKPSHLRGWLAAVARNLAARRRSREHNRMTREQTVAREEAAERSAADAVESFATHRAVVNAVMDLEEPYRTAVLLRFWEDMPPREVARRTGVPVETARTHIKRGVDRLRAQLDRQAGSRSAWTAPLLQMGVVRESLQIGSAAAGTTASVPILIGALAMKKAALATVAVALVLATVTMFTFGGDDSRVGDVTGSEGTLVAKADPAPARPGPEQPATGDVRTKGPDRRSLSTGLRLRGRVHDRLGRPIAAVPIVFAPRTAAAVDMCGHSSANGSFDVTVPNAFGQLRAGGRFIAVRGHRVRRMNSSQTFENCLLVVAPTVNVSGIVRDLRAHPLPHVNCWLRLQPLSSYPGVLDNTADADSVETTTDASGRFHFAALPAIPEASLHFSKKGYRQAVYPMPDRNAHGLDIVLSNDPSLAFRVSGVVKNVDGRVVPDATASLGFYAQAQTDETGRFVVETRDVWSEHPLVATKKGHQASVVPDIMAKLRNSPNNQLDDVVLVLPGKARTIQGRVVHHQGAPAIGLHVYLWDPTYLGANFKSAEAAVAGRQDERLGVSDTTDSGGRFHLGGLSDRDYVIRVHDKRTLLTLATRPIPAGTTGLEIVIPDNAMRKKVTGRIVALNGIGVANAQVSVGVCLHRFKEMTFGTSGHKVQTDNNGYFTLKNVSRRESYLRIGGESIVPRHFIVPPQHSGLELSIEVERRCHFRLDAGRFAGRKKAFVEVTDDLGKPLKIYTFSARGSSTSMRWHLGNKSHTMAVSERARWLVVREAAGFGKNTELSRQAIGLKPGVVTHLRL